MIQIGFRTQSAMIDGDIDDIDDGDVHVDVDVDGDSDRHDQ